MNASEGPLPSWQDSAAREEIVRFVEGATRSGGPDYLPPPERVAVFDNDGTLWCEKPLPVQADFLLRRVGEMAQQDPSLRSRQPWKSVVEKDYGWLSGAIRKHYHGDDSDLHEMAGGLLQAYSRTTIEEFEAATLDFMNTARHPTYDRPYLEIAYQPMIELLRYLDANGFTNYIASGGGRDFMRPVTQGLYGVPPERVIGSTVALEYDPQRNTLVHKAELDIFDDGPEKPVRVWSRLGRRPAVACGNSNGDLEMLRFAGGDRKALRLLVVHDDADREFAYTAGAERVIEQAKQPGWTPVSVRDDWRNVFMESRPRETSIGRAA
jgi:phosphoglycolate phosphatase-like HAD superfamily hydrolase